MSDNIILTGSTGFIGKHLLKELVSKGYVVHCLVNSPPQKKTTV